MAVIQTPVNPSTEFNQFLDDIEIVRNEKLNQAIPKELFKINVFRGMVGYTASLTLYLTIIWGLANATHWAYYVPLWLTGGLAAWGMFVIGHDCGHNSFSKSSRFNTVFGHIALMPILFPFYGWKHLHNQHHASANNIELDVDWKPITRAQYQKLPLWQRTLYISTRTWFWWVGTIRYQVHAFKPSMFITKKARTEVAISSIIVFVIGIAMLSVLTYYTGFSGLFVYFIGPWLCMHFWFSTVTFMQHSSEDIPYLTSKYWNPNASRLLLVTDFNYPTVIQFFMHNITVHAAHHVAPILPYYNLPKAREALSTKYPGMLRQRPFTIKALWSILRKCHFYDSDKGFYTTAREQDSTISSSIQQKNSGKSNEI